MTLPADVARCSGSQSSEGDWREGCEDCARRTAPAVPGRLMTMMKPPEIIVFFCPYYKEPTNG